MDGPYFQDGDHDMGFTALWRAYYLAFEVIGDDPYVGRRLVALLREA